MKYNVLVELKKEILDPEARAICETLQKQGFGNLKSLSISKKFTLELEETSESSLERVKKLAREHLSNPLSENVSVTQLDS